jgi:hypothetical protein
VIFDPSEARVIADLKDDEFLAGCAAGQWRVAPLTFPLLNFWVSAVEPDGTSSEYGFQAELTNYPAIPPKVRIWDHAANAPLANQARPKGGPRVEGAFKHWGDDTVYRPWDRQTGPHCSNTSELPHLAWNPSRNLTFIFKDLYGLLHCNARAIRLRPAA